MFVKATIVYLELTRKNTCQADNGALCTLCLTQSFSPPVCVVRSFDSTWSSNAIGSCTRQQSSSKLQFECSSAGNIGHNSSFLYDKHDSRARHRHTSGEGVEGGGSVCGGSGGGGGVCVEGVEGEGAYAGKGGMWAGEGVGGRGVMRGRGGCGREGCNERRVCGEGCNERKRRRVWEGGV